MKKQLLVLSAGTARTRTVNKLQGGLDEGEWDITIVDIGGVDLVAEEVDRVDAGANAVALGDGRTVAYDYLVIA